MYLDVIAPAKFIQLFFVPKVDWSVQILLLYFRLIVHFESGVSISAFLNIYKTKLIVNLGSQYGAKFVFFFLTFSTIFKVERSYGWIKLLVLSCNYGVYVESQVVAVINLEPSNFWKAEQSLLYTLHRHPLNIYSTQNMNTLFDSNFVFNF